MPPKLRSVSLGDAEVVALKQTVGKDGLELCQHVAEDQRQFGEVPSAGAERHKGTNVTLHKFHLRSRHNSFVEFDDAVKDLRLVYVTSLIV